MGNWNQITITPENGEELYLEGGRSCKFSVNNYRQFVLGFIASQVKDNGKCDVFIKDDYCNDHCVIEPEIDYKFTCIITSKEYLMKSTKDADFTDEAFWDGYFHWDECDLFPISGVFYITSHHEEYVLWVFNGVPYVTGEVSVIGKAESVSDEVKIEIIRAYNPENEKIIRLAESGNIDLAFELLKGLYAV